MLGFDSDFDHAALSQDARRRLFPSSPAQSLLLRKAVGSDPHAFGDRQRRLSNAVSVDQRRSYSTREGEASLEKVELVQDDYVLQTDETSNLKTIATYSDGSSRDVTLLTTYLSNDDAVASVDRAGQVTAGELPGETAVMARYRNHICVANISIPRPNPLSEGLFDSIERRNYIDELVYEKLETQRIEPSETVRNTFS